MITPAWPDLYTVSLCKHEWKPREDLFYEYVLAKNGLFVVAANHDLRVQIQLAELALAEDLKLLVESAVLRAPAVPYALLHVVLESARRHLPNEAMYQFTHEENGERFTRGWTCRMPRAFATPTALEYEDDPDTLIDLHSHGTMPAFFSSTDDADEKGFRFYVVIGNVDTPTPTIAARVGIYGRMLNVDPRTLFDNIGNFQTIEESNE